MVDTDIRLQAVERFKTLNLEKDTEFQDLVNIASSICHTSIALLTLIDSDTQWMKVGKGINIIKVPRETTFCIYTIQSDAILVVPDAMKDERFANNPVTNDLGVRFYAGAPLITSDGYRVGSLCVVDIEPHKLSKQQKVMLKLLSKHAINLMELRVTAIVLEQSKFEFNEKIEKIKQTENSRRSFFESAPNFHVFLNSDGKVVDFNKVAFNFIQKIHNHVLAFGDTFVKFVEPDFIDRFKSGFTNALAGKNAFEEGSTDYGPHGLIYWEASFETAKDASGSIIGVSYIIRDVSDRKVKELKIVAQNKSLLKIAHLESHEFRAPLTSIIGMMELIKAEDYNAPREYYELLEKSVLNFDKKIHKIVDYIDRVITLDKSKSQRDEA